VRSLVEQITPVQWRVLIAAGLGWMLDALDVMLFALALGAIRSEFGLGAAGAGALASVTLLASAVGGILFGFLADRYGRARALIVSILTYSVFTALTATSRSVAELTLWRALVGIGLGGEWSAGSVLVAETWPAEHRGKAIGLMQSGWAVGYAAAALLAAAILPTCGWRALFAVGIAPALLTVWIRRRVPEPEVWNSTGRRPLRDALALLRPPLLQRAVVSTALATSLLFAYWGLFTWVPSYLASPEAAGGAGLGIARSSLWIVVMQAGAFLGYTSFGFLADRFGRRPTLQAFVLGAAILVPPYALLARSGIALLALGPLVGFFGHGYFSVFGAMLAELFPSAIRGAAQGICYNAGRAASALAPWTIGALADRFGLGVALASTSACFLLGAVMVLLLPETRGRELT
jgi:MFS family permease